MTTNTVKSAFESSDELVRALRMKASHETAQHLSVIQMASEVLGNQRKLLERTLAMFDGGCIGGDLRALLDDVRNHLEATK